MELITHIKNIKINILNKYNIPINSVNLNLIYFKLIENSENDLNKVIRAKIGFQGNYKTIVIYKEVNNKKRYYDFYEKEIKKD